MGPIYLGRRELEVMHLAHHRTDGGPGDPDRRRQVSVLYPGDQRAVYETPMLGWSLAFYASYLLFCFGAAPGWAFGLFGFACVLRYFNRWHEWMHAGRPRRAGNAGDPE